MEVFYADCTYNASNLFNLGSWHASCIVVFKGRHESPGKVRSVPVSVALKDVEKPLLAMTGLFKGLPPAGFSQQ